MKLLYYLLLSSMLFSAPACSSSKNDPAPSILPEPTPPVPTWTTTNNGAPVAISVALNGYGDVQEGGLMVSRFILTAINNTGQADIKFYLTSATPMGTVTQVAVRGFGESTYSYGLNVSTATGRIVTEKGVSHLYVSGTYLGFIGAGYGNFATTFTDLKAY